MTESKTYPKELPSPVLCLPDHKSYARLRKDWLHISDQVYENSCRVTYTVQTSQSNLICTVMSALYMAGKRKLIPEYDQLPQTQNEIQGLLLAAKLWTAFVLTDTGLVISVQEVGGISELSSSLRDRILAHVLKEEKELKKFCEDEEDYQFLDDWKSLVAFRKANFQ